VKGQDVVDHIRKQIALMDNSYVTIGVHEGAGDYDTGVSVVQVALWNEFGTETVPERSFLRSTVDENQSLFQKYRDDAIANIVAGKSTVAKELDAIGFNIAELIRNKIKSNIEPAYGTGKAGKSADAIAKAQQAKQNKGQEPVTLIASGLMLRSITWEVHLK
jgi:hypothetical protein